MTDPSVSAAQRPARLDAVLSFAWGRAAFTASDAMAGTGLTRSTTIDAIDALVELGLLRELPNAREAGEYLKGRPARRFELSADAAVLVGVDAGRAHLTVTVADLSGSPLVTQRHDLDIDHDSTDERRTVIAEGVDEALAAAGRSREDILSMCVGVPAPVDADGASPAHHDRFWQRMNPGLAELFSTWAPLVRVENDAALAAFAEGAAGAAQGCSNYVSLLAGARLGAGVVVDGHLLRGSHGGVGETVLFDWVVGVGSADGLGLRAAQWAKQDVAAQKVSPTSALATTSPDQIDGKLVLELAASGDPDALRIVERVGQVLARVAGVLACMFNPQLIIVSGALSVAAEPLVATARGSLSTGLDLPPPQLLTSTLGADVVVRGAVAAATTTARSRGLDVWLHRQEHEARLQPVG
ncbi:MAG: ROK family protein [Ornithinimicrobium sp.]